MSDRTAEDVRKEISAERRALQEDVDGLKKELRSLLPFALAGFVIVVLATVGALIGIRRLRSHKSITYS